MSAYNILKTKINCSNYLNEYTNLIQFKFVDTWQLLYYIGDKIKWEGNDIGSPGLATVKVYEILEENICSICYSVKTNNEYDLVIIKDVIVHVNPINDNNDYLSGNESFKICK